MSKMVHYLIVGNSAAGVAAAEEIRKRDKKGSIMLISEEDHLSYSRPLLARYLFGEFSLEKLSFRRKDFFQRLEISIRLKTRVTQLIPEKKMVLAVERDGLLLQKEKEFSYDNLLLSTGSVPLKPRILGCGLEGVFTFLSLSEVERIKDYLARNSVKEVLILGGGLIGLESAEAFHRLGFQVRIVELAPYLLSTTFDRYASEIVAVHLSRNGLIVHTQDTVESFGGSRGRICRATLKKGGEVKVDLAVIAVGVRPRVELAEEAGLQVGKGIVIDREMRTSATNIYAAGDCVQVENLLSGVKGPLPLWPEAVRQGKAAGMAMASTDSLNKRDLGSGYKGGIVMNALEILGLPTVSVGITDDPGAEVFSEYLPEKGFYRKILVRQNRVIGYIFIGSIERSGIYTGLIKEKVDVTAFKDKLLEEDFGLVYLPSDYQKHLVSGEGVEV